MHGVASEIAQSAFKCFNLKPFIETSKQMLPDPLFSTVEFPNPEEKGALNIAISVAEESNAPIVLASDPDADRFAAAEKIE